MRRQRPVRWLNQPKSYFWAAQDREDGSWRIFEQAIGGSRLIRDEWVTGPRGGRKRYEVREHTPPYGRGPSGLLESPFYTNITIAEGSTKEEALRCLTSRSN